MQRSRELFEQAQRFIPGGVNSPVRACRSVDAEPLFIRSGHGCRLTDVDGREYIDYVLSWGPMLLGHTHPVVTQAIQDSAAQGASFGAPCEQEVELARMLVEALPAVDMVRMVNSGTEATMSALRLARAVTKRDKVLKFEGCYHGHGDAFLASAGSGVLTLSLPGTPGVPADTVKDTLIAPYNDLEAAARVLEANKGQVAAIIVEPVAGNMGLVLPAEGFLQGLRELCDQHGALLIFDEVITGFRVAYGGAQNRFGVTPDLTTLGKIIGGGMPVGAYGGKAEFMERIAPAGEVYQAGTLAGNPVAMAAGVATLKALRKADYDALEQAVGQAARATAEVLRSKGAPVQVNHIASMFTLFFTDKKVTDFATAKSTDTTIYAKYYRQMRDAGIYLAPSNFECAMVSFAHTKDDFEQTLEAVQTVDLS